MPNRRSAPKPKRKIGAGALASLIAIIGFVAIMAFVIVAKQAKSQELNSPSACSAQIQ